MITIKLPYEVENVSDKELILEYIKQYSNCLHFMYNRVVDGLSETEIKHLPINNIELLDSWFKQSCVKESTQIHKTNKNGKVIFGGKKNYFNRLNNKITKEEFKLKKLSPLYSIGEGSNKGVKGNRKFNILDDHNTIIFKPNRTTKIKLILPKLRNNYRKTFEKLYKNQELRNFSITYKLDMEFIYISFDETCLGETNSRNYKENRIISIDLNPNYIGWSVVDWLSENKFNVIKSGVFSLKHLNDKEKDFKKEKLNSGNPKRVYINNKRNFETLQISKKIIEIGLHYHVELFSMEDLNMKSSDKNLGKNFNRLCNNQWIRDILVRNLTKKCNIHNIKLQKVKPNYSSFIGNFLYRGLKLPDMVLSSIEIGRRSYEYNCQYIKKIKEIKKNIILPCEKFYGDLIIKSLEEFNINEKFNTLIELYSYLKNSKIKYRVSLDDLHLKFFRQKHLKYEHIYT